MKRNMGRHVYMGWSRDDVSKIHRWIKANKDNPVIFGNREVETMFPDRSIGSVQAKFYEQMSLLKVKTIRNYRNGNRWKRHNPKPATEYPANYPHIDAITEWCRKNLIAGNSEMEELIKDNEKLKADVVRLKSVLDDITSYINIQGEV